LYLDGDIIDEGVVSSHVIDGNSDNFYIGSRGNDYFNGIMDEFIIFNRTLTDQEIDYLYYEPR
jgi:hypothetical protein